MKENVNKIIFTIRTTKCLDEEAINRLQDLLYWELAGAGIKVEIENNQTSYIIIEG